MAENRNSKRGSSSEGISGKKPSKKEKSFSRNKAMRQERSAESFKEGGYKSKGSGFKPKAFGKPREGSKDRGAFLRNDKYADKKRSNFKDKEKDVDMPKKDFKKSDSSDYKERKPYGSKEGGYKKSDDSDYKERKSYGNKEGRFEKKSREFKSSKFEGKEGYKKSRSSESGERKSFRDKSTGFDKKSEGFKSKIWEEKADFKKSSSNYGDRKSFAGKGDKFEKKSDGFKDRKRRDDGEEKGKRFKQDEFEERSDYKKSDAYEKFKSNKGKDRSSSKSKGFKKSDDGLVRLNKFLANAGVASRRDADVLIQSGAVTVNGVVVTEMGFKVKSTDDINYGGEAIRGERKVYLLLNKPKDCITTTDDPQERKTVMNLVKTACKERIYPVGRLDRNTTGLLLLTNDGEIAARLTHPKYNIKKVYQVSLTKGLKVEDMQQIVDGIELEDGFIKADEVAYVGEGKKEIGIEIHSGRNRIVRRIFEHLGYDVLKLDRVAFAGLTKKDLPRGKYRFLEPKEVAFLRMVGG
jgi:23S rRNA pseudouridine2605 synthase